MPAGSTALATAARTAGSARGPEAVLRRMTTFWKEGVSTTWTRSSLRRLSTSCGVRRSAKETSPLWTSWAAVVGSGTTR